MIREYTCPKCKKTEERLVKLSTQDEQYCNKHSNVKLERIKTLSSIPIKFKGPFH